MTILPLVTGSNEATCTICDQKATRAVVTTESCPVIESICEICARSAIAFTQLGIEDWANVADRIRSEMAGEEDCGPDESMDGDHETALRDAGFGTDEDYGYYGGGEE